MKEITKKNKILGYTSFLTIFPFFIGEKCSKLIAGKRKLGVGGK